MWVGLAAITLAAAIASSLWQFRIASISQSLLAFVGPLL
jgi:hypothetical protein